MKKLGTVSAVVLATVLSAVSAQAAEPVRPASSEMTAIYGLPATARVGRVKARKVSAMAPSGTVVAAAAAGAATVGLIWALTDNGNGKQSSPGGN
jgi:hypothetical protein